MTWTAGRRLAAMTNSAGNEYYTFTYNDEGIRTSKTAYGVTHKYLLSGSQIIAEDLGDKLIVYLYDENGSPMGMQYRTSSMAANTFYTFWFEKNLQGDIIAVYNESGTKLISYTYDAWGNVTQTVHNHAGSNSYAGYNPFRYRGYYYDTETKLYYLNSRYYNPEIGRFINADGQLNGGLLGYNQFAYCHNNPVNRIDPQGTMDGALSPVWASSMWWLTFSDGPIPAGDIIYVVGIGVTGFIDLVNFIGYDNVAIVVTELPNVISQTTDSINSNSIPKANTDAKADTKDIAKTLPEDTIIYRWPKKGTLDDISYTPSYYDTLDPKSGLSFSTKPKPGSACTTIGELNSTGIVFAVQDGLEHVSVYPVGGTLQNWHDAGQYSPWSLAVKSVCIKWDGN